MDADHDSFLAQMRISMEKRITEQIKRHRAIDPTGDVRQVIDIQLRQERERLEKLLEDEENPRIAEAIQVLIDDYLPIVAKQLKR